MEWAATVVAGAGVKYLRLDCMRTGSYLTTMNGRGSFTRGMLRAPGGGPTCTRRKFGITLKSIPLRLEQSDCQSGMTSREVSFSVIVQADDVTGRVLDRSLMFSIPGHLESLLLEDVCSFFKIVYVKLYQTFSAS